uniref:Uncharacterized protein n=1 Tax=Pithovirus LCPAC202 TaxID=2506592 RepID=A0A481Z5J9_9VIRU|nr:MAG: hypothetical protein LCPAC202_01380 [Pithovirus LCPAC202]
MDPAGVPLAINNISFDQRHHRQLTKTGIQSHIYSGIKNPSILPQLGTILYRQRKNKSAKIDSRGVKQPIELVRLVVVYIQTKARGVNKGIVDLASLLPVIKIENNEVYYDFSANPFVLRLTNRGKWFTKSLLKLYDLSWDQPINTLVGENKKYNFLSIKSQLSPPIAASSELAKNVLLNPAGIILPPPELSPTGLREIKIISPVVGFSLEKSAPIQIIRPKLKIQNQIKLNEPAGRSWEMNLIKIPERSRSNTISLPGTVPSFIFPVNSTEKKIG